METINGDQLTDVQIMRAAADWLESYGVFTPLLLAAASVKINLHGEAGGQ